VSDILSSVIDCKMMASVAGSFPFFNKQKKLRGLRPRANYTDRATAACRNASDMLQEMSSQMTSFHRFLSISSSSNGIDLSNKCWPFASIVTLRYNHSDWIFGHFNDDGSPLWYSGQSSWLQIRRPGFDSRHYQKKK
jgi:hypothetical protein